MAVAPERGAVEDLTTEGVARAAALLISPLQVGVAFGQHELVALELGVGEVGAVDDGAITVDGEDFGVVREADDTLGDLVELSGDIVKSNLGV